MYDVVVVGAGPIGSRTAELIAKNGFKVAILEEHPEIGKPVQCSGLVSHRIFELSGSSDNVIVNTTKKARFYSPNGKCIELKSKKPVYVIDREKFDKELSMNATNAGVEIKRFTKFKNFKKMKHSIKIKTSEGFLESKILVGADGPYSSVAQTSKIKLPKNVLIGMQSVIKSEYETDIVELWFDSKISPDFFGWVIPENEEWARVGLASRKNALSYFKNFLRIRFHHEIEQKNSLAGVIRYGLIKNSVSDRAILVGDAASQVKPFSGGGIVYGLICASIASDACIKSLKIGNYSKKFFKENYNDIWKRKLFLPIKKGLMISKVIHSFPDNQLNFLFSTLRKSKFTKLMEFTDMDLL